MCIRDSVYHEDYRIGEPGDFVWAYVPTALRLVGTTFQEVIFPYLDKKVKIVAISNENHDKIQEFIERREIDLEFLKLNADLNYFGAYSLPTTIVFDKEGKESFRIASGIDFASQNFVQKILDLEKL